MIFTKLLFIIVWEHYFKSAIGKPEKTSTLILSRSNLTNPDHGFTFNVTYILLKLFQQMISNCIFLIRKEVFWGSYQVGAPSATRDSLMSNL